MNNLRFARQFLLHPKQLGTVVQSGRALASRMADEVGPSVHVVEFGAGTGPVTREILRRLPANATLTSFEINRDFCRCLEEIDDPRLEVVNDDALRCDRYVDQPDCIVSGLPLTLFDGQAREAILAIARRAGRFVQLQYTTAITRDLRRYFSDVRLQFVPLNFPPAFVYVCRCPSEVRVS
ncbi:MAG TPA: rRNA adenine N-6-methyltransferase family protein [Sedimentisphaerales bacterium]|jgi:phospholipid N-methyltransferase|nr:rRNA adenine N-6-methyltransferase family protein [Sedimentisphaerales bacterium]HNU30633.1 rRNA adenine N-6-methyltransferase family protein [Sedimentisphaerales bacterium]